MVVFKDEQIDTVLKALENADAYLTAAIVSKDIQFQNKVSVNKSFVTLLILFRSSHTPLMEPRTVVFEPELQERLKTIGLDLLAIQGNLLSFICVRESSDEMCRGAGIGSPEAIKLVWSCHREIIYDQGPILESWVQPESS